jgi:hypothetical protein
VRLAPVRFVVERFAAGRFAAARFRVDVFEAARFRLDAFALARLRVVVFAPARFRVDVFALARFRVEAFAAERLVVEFLRAVRARPARARDEVPAARPPARTADRRVRSRGADAISEPYTSLTISSAFDASPRWGALNCTLFADRRYRLSSHSRPL